MKFVTFVYQGRRSVGLVDASGVLPLENFESEIGASMQTLIRKWDGVQAKLLEWAAKPHPHLALQNVHLLAPVPRPGKIFAIGLNYRDHIREAGLGEPTEQIWFCKQATSVNGPYDPIPLPAASNQVDYEAELVVVIGRGGRNIARADALSAVFGFCCGNDVSMRDWQKKSPQWSLSKSADGHAPFGPWLTTVDETGDPQALDIRSFVNGEQRQNSNTRHMVYTVADQIVTLSQVMTLEPGDVIFTGTPGGVGMGMTPPCWLKDGDTVRVEIEKLGALKATCRATA